MNEENVSADSLFEQFPELKPADPKARPISSLNMKILQQKPNGDLVLQYSRSSNGKNSKKSISLQATLDGTNLSIGDNPTTDDLSDIFMIQQEGEEKTERRSTQWENEYTMRVSGFSEIESEQAKSIERARESLRKSLANVNKNKVAMGRERNAISKERDENRKAAEQTKNDISALKDTIEGQKTRLKEVEDQLKEVQEEKNKFEQEQEQQ